jgi:hypothetical protein
MVAVGLDEDEDASCGFDARSSHHPEWRSPVHFPWGSVHLEHRVERLNLEDHVHVAHALVTLGDGL